MIMNYNMEDKMSHILEVRYTDLEEEKQLCQEMLAWAIESENTYAKAFALTYLGDYYIGVYEEKLAGDCLMEADSLMGEGPDWEELRLRMYILLGIYHDMRMDEQSSVEYYLKAIRIAVEIEDEEVQCVALNNLAFSFQRHGCYEQALEYYLKAYYIQVKLKYQPVANMIIGNLAEVYLSLHQYEKARSFIEKCEQLEGDSYYNRIMNYKNWCGYYAAVGEKEKALQYAELLLQNTEAVNEDKLTAFETYQILFENMMHLKDKSAEQFLKAMENVGSDGSMDQVQILEKSKIAYTLMFEPPEKHAMAYRRFYQKNQEYRARMNQIIANAMKSKIILEDLMQQTQVIQTEQASLEKEVNWDELTGIYSRKFMEDLMQEKTEGSLGILILDVDYFKEYNDYYGHVNGDHILKQIADTLMACKTDHLYPCRYGGDEYVCICREITEEEIIAYIRSVRKHLHAKALPHEKSPCCNEVTLSIGYAVGGLGSQMEAHLLLQHADQALYQCKRSGRNAFTGKKWT